MDSRLVKELYKAAQEGQLNLVKEIIDKGADPNAEHPVIKSTALIAAAQNGYIHIVEYLIQKGADPHKKSGIGHKTASEYAKERGYISLFNYLNKNYPERYSIQKLISEFSLN